MGYEYQIVSGIYFEGRNYTIQHVIASTFQKRLKYKEEKNPMQNVYKLMLNSSYGKTIESIHDTKFNIMTEDTLTPYLRRNKNIIKSV